MKKNTVVVADSSEQAAIELSAGVVVEAEVLKAVINSVLPTPPAVLIKHKQIVKRDKKAEGKKIRPTIEPTSKATVVKKVVEEKPAPKVEAISIPAETKSLIDEAFSKLHPVVEKFVCPICQQEYMYVLNGMRNGKEWKKYVHDSYENLVGKLVATEYCEAASPKVVETRLVKELVEEALEKRKYAREVAPCLERLSKLFSHAVDRKFIHLYEQASNGEYVQIGTASPEPVGEKLLDLIINTTSSEIWNVGEKITVELAELFTIGNFVGYKVL
jgi:hypothetical protein